MLKAIAKRYKENRDCWDNKDGYVQPVIPYWLFLVLMSVPVVLIASMIYQVATR